MDFRLTADQLAVQDLTRGYCERTYTPERVAALAGRGPDRGAWTELADLGILGLRLPGADTGWVEVVVAYEVLGYHLVSGPLVWSQLLAGCVPGVAEGTRIVTGLERTAGAPLVEYLGLADDVAVLDDGVRLVPARAATSLGDLVPLDPLTPVGCLADPDGGDRLLDAGAVPRLRTEGAVLCSALLVGIADRALDLACEHAQRREQFGRPIGAFQAIQHLLADMYVRVMLARSAAYAAAAILDDPAAGDPEVAAAGAKAVATDAAMANARTCTQVHGGMGFTWEMMPHYLLKRTWVLEHAFGTAAQHTERIAADLGSAAIR